MKIKVTEQSSASVPRIESGETLPRIESGALPMSVILGDKA